MVWDISTNVGMFLDFGRLMSKLYRSCFRVFESKVPNYLEITIGTYWGIEVFFTKLN
jgi:hypothetical protein